MIGYFKIENLCMPIGIFLIDFKIFLFSLIEENSNLNDTCNFKTNKYILT